MINKLIIGVALFICTCLVIACGVPMVTPIRVPEPEIPQDFKTYTSQGLFSISYPSNYVEANSMLEDLLKIVQEKLKGTDPELNLEDARMLFFGGFPEGEGYYPTVSIVIVPRMIGYWKLDEIVEIETRYSRENSQQYREFSQVKTVVDGRESIIIDSQDYTNDDGYWRYMQLFTIKDKFVWFVTCSSESDDFDYFRNTFNDIVRSLRLLN
jgi:hypothetical protein